MSKNSSSLSFLGLGLIALISIGSLVYVNYQANLNLINKKKKTTTTLQQQTSKENSEDKTTTTTTTQNKQTNDEMKTTKESSPSKGKKKSSTTDTRSTPVFTSTRGYAGEDGKGISFENAVLLGLGPDGGLFVPSFFPQVTQEQLISWRSLSFQQLATEIIHLYIPDDLLTKDELYKLICRSYDSTFRDKAVVPVVRVASQTNQTAPPLILLELFHGPTFAFKDVALQFLGNMFEHILSRKEGSEASITVLGATSGDTGSSAIYGLRGKKGVNVFILFPEGMVSPIQEKQMTTVQDENVHCIAVHGTFDDAQRIVKSCFLDEEFRSKYNLGAVNSINFARILAQIVYYFYSYFRVYDGIELPIGNLPTASFSVPTGNFGDILAGYYAKLMGLPVARLVVATNENDILDRFFKHGEYFKQAKVINTNTPSMDICVSSNFERFLYHMAGNDANLCKTLMKEFEATGKLVATPALLARSQEQMSSAAVSQSEVLKTVANVYKERGYVLDPHSAIGVAAAIPFVHAKGEPPMVSLLTAHWAKFIDATNSALGEEKAKQLPMPEELTRLESLPTRKTLLPATEQAIKHAVTDILG